jgi:hypothetical protein
MFVKVEFFLIESKSKRGFEKGDMHVVITIESTTIVLSIVAFQLELILIFFIWIPLENSEVLFKNWKSTTIAIIIIDVKGIGDSKGEKKLLIANGKGEFDQDILTLGNNLLTKYEQFLEVYNGGHYGMVITKNVTTTKKGD